MTDSCKIPKVVIFQLAEKSKVAVVQKRQKFALTVIFKLIYVVFAVTKDNSSLKIIDKSKRNLFKSKQAVLHLSGFLLFRISLDSKIIF